MTEKLNIGDRVILTDISLIPAKFWPVWGSKYECVGTVTDIEDNIVSIAWDNNKHVMLTHRHLSLHTDQSLSPNAAFLKYKRSRHNDTD